MRLIALAAVSFALVPSVAFAQDWQDWVKSNPTYGAPPAPAPVVQPAPAPVKAAPAPVKAAPKPAPKTSVYPREFDEGFMPSCTSGAMKQGASAAQAKSYCGCALRNLKATYTPDQFVQVVKNMLDTGVLPEKFQKAVIPCAAAMR
jgi:hypothetical protein